jgi:FkbM family methyltransferase
MTKVLQLAKRIAEFPGKSWSQKVSSFATRWNRWFPGFPPPVLLPNGTWWLFEMNFIGSSILEGGYENAECNFERRFLKPGMTALDIGANCGFHSLLLSKSVGPGGRVLAFEPSPSDRKKLRVNLAMNFCRNVSVLPWALGEEDGDATLYVVEGNTVLNSLRSQANAKTATPTRVVVRPLDKVLRELRVEKVDFIKLDVEGAELPVLKGAARLLGTVPRPVILCEVQEETSRAWGYSSRQIVELLSAREFVWFRLDDHGDLVPVTEERSGFGRNLVAVPAESLQSVAPLRASAKSEGNPISADEFATSRGAQ